MPLEVIGLVLGSVSSLLVVFYFGFLVLAWPMVKYSSSADVVDWNIKPRGEAAFGRCWGLWGSINGWWPVSFLVLMDSA